MSRTDITVRATTGTGTAQRIAVSGGWLQIPSAAPGVFRIRPLSGEATASSTQRLADTYQLTLPQLLDGADITLHRQGTPPAAELHLSHTAAQHLAILARAPLPRLTRAPPPLAPSYDAHDTAAAARWKQREAAQPVRACTLCTRHRSHGITDTARVHPAPQGPVCPRHQQAAPDPRLSSTVHTHGAPELATAHHAHQHPLRHPRAATAWTAARAVTPRWYDHQPHLAHRWHPRLNQLCEANRHLTSTGSATPCAPDPRLDDLSGNRCPHPRTRHPAEPATSHHQRRPHPHRPPTRPHPPDSQRQRPTPRLPHPHTPLTSQNELQRPAGNTASHRRTTTSTGNPRSFPHHYRTAGQAPEQTNRTRHQTTPITPQRSRFHHPESHPQSRDTRPERPSP